MKAEHNREGLRRKRRLMVWLGLLIMALCVAQVAFGVLTGGPVLASAGVLLFIINAACWWRNVKVKI